MQTILPTLAHEDLRGKVHVLANALYFESEGCHDKETALPGMNQFEIADFLSSAGWKCNVHANADADADAADGHDHDHDLDHDLDQHGHSLQFVGFDKDPNAGWYSHATGPETRSESEQRAVAFYTWLCDYLDLQLQSGENDGGHGDDDDHHEDIFDAGVALPTETHEIEHDRHSPRQRRRRTILCIGHGDFMSLVLKRIVAGFGHSIENEGIPHRSGFVHYNTGITELEYFGKGRFLVMRQNHTPHLNDGGRGEGGEELTTGGGLKDGWSYIMPADRVMLYEEVTFAFADEHDKHVLEQVGALQRLYSARISTMDDKIGANDNDTSETDTGISMDGGKKKHYDKKTKMTNRTVTGGGSGRSTEMIFIVKRGAQVAGCITFHEHTGELVDLAIRPSLRKGTTVAKDLIQAVKDYAKESGKSQVFARMSEEDRHWFEDHGFREEVLVVGEEGGGGNCNENEGQIDSFPSLSMGVYKLNLARL